jgi:putative oxidoreductase
MTEIGLPFPEFMALFLASVEFYGGLLLMVGLFSTFCAIALTIAMIVAIVTVEIDQVIPKGIGFFDWMSWFLYLPQVMYVILFVWLISTGPGQYSIDHYLAKKLGVGSDDQRAGKD